MCKGKRASETYRTLYVSSSTPRTRWHSKAILVKRLLQLGGKIGARTAIEFGCGLGEDAIELQLQSGWHITATDACGNVIGKLSESVDSRVLDVTNFASYPQETYDLAFCSFLVHLLTPSEKKVFYKSVFYLLRPGGAFAILTASENDLRNRRITRYFPSSLSIDLKRYQTISENKRLLRWAGFHNVGIESISMEVNSAEADLAIFRCQSSSVLRLVPKAEYRRGMKLVMADIGCNNSIVPEWSRTLIICYKD